MAPQDDLTAERAAKQYTMNDLFKLAMEGKVNIVEDRFVSAAALKTARQEALRDVVVNMRKSLALYGNDQWRERKAIQEWIDHFAEAGNMVQLDRLASEGASAPIDLLPKLKDDGGYGEHF